MPETAVRTTVLERFLRYVTYDTQSAEGSTTYPSTLEAARAARPAGRGAARRSGSTDAARDEHGYVMATIPAHDARRRTCR